MAKRKRPDSEPTSGKPGNKAIDRKPPKVAKTNGHAQIRTPPSTTPSNKNINTKPPRVVTTNGTGHTELPISSNPENGINGAEPSKVAKSNGGAHAKPLSPTIQIITGSYERVLHGITATLTIPPNAKTSTPPSTNTETPSSAPPKPTVDFAQTFLFNAHASSIRCLALSPLPHPTSPDQTLYLASGGSDEKVNVFSLSARPPPPGPAFPALGGSKVVENPRNRELGALLSHSSNITALHFPSRGKLLSAGEDNMISVARVRDLTTVSSIKVPRPKAVGQPSGDTNAVGVVSAGVNDFSVHWSGKVMLSVGRGERCLRLWNLVTGRKAGVLQFERKLLEGVRETKHSSGEARRVRWSPSGSDFVVAFERGCAVFGEDSKARCRVLPTPPSKIHQLWWGSLGEKEVIAISTEDGRVVFFDPATTQDAPVDDNNLLLAKAIWQIGGRAAGIISRVKDFEALPLEAEGGSASAVVVTASSDGAVRVWYVDAEELAQGSSKADVKQIGTLVGTHDTGDRITCLRAFVMLPPQEDDDFQEDEVDEFGGFSGEEDSGSSGSEDER
jgi:protein MAK11